MSTTMQEIEYESLYDQWIEDQRFAEKMERGECIRCSEPAEDELRENGTQMCVYCYNLMLKVWDE
jgi:hypothetical protein